jgi:hypothetical protein
MEIMQKHGIKPTSAVNSMIGEPDNMSQMSEQTKEDMKKLRKDNVTY